MKLRTLECKDADGMLEWMHDAELCAGFRFDGNQFSREDVLRFIDNSMTDLNRHYAVVNDADEYLGTISLKKIGHGTAEYAIALRKRATGTGIAKEATRKLLEVAFEELYLEMVYLNVLADNIRAIRLYEKVGFIYRRGKDSEIMVNGINRKLKWYTIERGQYEKIS